MRALTLLWTVVLTIMSAGQARSFNAVQEDVVFVSEGARLSGTLMFPAGEAKAVIVLIQGAGRQERLTRLANAIASKGYVIFTYDKRGIGRSEGVYEGKNNVSATNINLLAEDVATAIQELRGAPALQHLPFGLLGISQAGWIGPLAAVKAGGLNFMGFWGGPTCKVSEQLRFQKARDLEGKDAAEQDLTNVIISITAGGDVDPSNSLRSLHIPSMWMFGGADTQVPAALSIRRLEALIAEGRPEFTYYLYPKEEHPALSDRSLGDMLKWLDATITASHAAH